MVELMDPNKVLEVRTRYRLVLISGPDYAVHVCKGWIGRWIEMYGFKAREVQLRMNETDVSMHAVMDGCIDRENAAIVIGYIETDGFIQTSAHASDALGHPYEWADAVISVGATGSPSRYAMNVVKDRWGMLPTLLAIRV